MKKKWIILISIIVIVILVLFAVPLSIVKKHPATNNTTPETEISLKYELNESGDGYIVVNKGNIPDDAEEIVIPAEYDGKPVVAIGSKAFSFSRAKSIEIPNTVKSIGENAFEYCYFITDIVLPEGLESIGDYAFTKCIALTEATVPESVSYMGEGVFQECTSLVTANIPNKITVIKKETFAGCGSMTEISLHNGITAIEERAFNYCKSLKNITIPNGVTYIGANAFSYCESLEKIVIPNSVTKLGNSSFYNCISLTEIYIPDSVVEADGELFDVYMSSSNIVTATLPANLMNYVYLPNVQYLTVKGGGEILYEKIGNSLKTLVIGEGVTGIGADIFKSQRGLVSVVMGNDVEYIGKSAFEYCPNLKTVILSNKLTLVGNNAFDSCNSLEYNEYDNAYYLGSESNKYIYCAKAKSTDITAVQINEQTRIIGYSAFSSCKYLETLSIYNWLNAPYPELISIGELAFYDCDALVSVSLPNGVKVIGNNAFENAEIDTLKLPESIEKIGACAFKNAEIGSAYVSNLAKWCAVDLVDSYSSPWPCAETAYIGGQEAISIRIPKSVEYINGYAFNDIKSLTTVTFEEGSSLKALTGFAGCSNLQNIEIPEGIESVGGLSGCGFYSISLPASVKRIEAYAFSGSSLFSIYMTDNVEYIGNNAFSNCRQLRDITLPASIAEIDFDLFYDCKALETITIPDSVTVIRSRAFNGSGLKNLTVGKGVKHIGDGAFENCNSLTNVYIYDVAAWCGITFETTFSGARSRWFGLR